MSSVAPDPLDRDVPDELLEAIHRPHDFVPLGLYDEITKLAEYALRDLLEERAKLVEVARAARDGVRIASQYLDTGRGDLDGWIERAESALARLEGAA